MLNKLKFKTVLAYMEIVIGAIFLADSLFMNYLSLNCFMGAGHTCGVETYFALRAICFGISLCASGVVLLGFGWRSWLGQLFWIYTCTTFFFLELTYDGRIFDLVSWMKTHSILVWLFG